MGPLEVVQKLADGSAVDAFLARSGEHTVLVQVSRPELAQDAELFGRFLDSTRRSTSLSHPSLLSPKSATLGNDGRFTLVTGPVSGWTAADALATRGTIPAEEVRRWGRALGEALGFLHVRGLVHGNISPRNVFLDGDPLRPEAKLLDTHLLLFRAGRSLKVNNASALVASEYLAPERASGHRATALSDVYGLGVLLFELLTGRPPHRGGSSAETRQLHLSGGRPVVPQSAAAWQPFFDRALARTPAGRFASMQDLLQALETAGLGPVVTPPPVMPDDVVLGQPLDEADLYEGDVLGVWKLEKCLGEGGMGRVFRARHTSLGTVMAIKILPAELAKKPALVQRFLQEAQAVSRVKHPNIIALADMVHQSRQGGDVVYFVMELLEGASVRELGQGGPVELSRVVALMRQAAEALEAAHQVGVVHRDIKPDNLFVTGQGATERLKVLDFGVARIRGPDAQPRMTSTGQVVGTPLWMAPEQVMGLDVDARADVYALASVMYVMIRRRFPFDGASSNDVVMNRLSGEARHLGHVSFLGEAIPPALSDLVMRCLSRDPRKRPQSMAEVAAALGVIERGLGQEDIETGADRPARQVPAPKRSFWLKALPFAILAAASGAATWWALLR